jgi:ribose 5-phosphate isomerase B
MLYLGADHRGFKLKEKLKIWLEEKKIKYQDLGAEELDPTDDYPDIAQKVAQAVGKQQGKGVLLCGSGAGVAIVANKMRGIRAAIGFNPQQVRAMRQDDDLNILCLATDYISRFKAFQLVKIFLQTEFKAKEKYRRRLEKINQLEQG